MSAKIDNYFQSCKDSVEKLILGAEKGYKNEKRRMLTHTPFRYY